MSSLLRSSAARCSAAPRYACRPRAASWAGRARVLNGSRCSAVRRALLGVMEHPLRSHGRRAGRAGQAAPYPDCHTGAWLAPMTDKQRDLEPANICLSPSAQQQRSLLESQPQQTATPAAHLSYRKASAVVPPNCHEPTLTRRITSNPSGCRVLAECASISSGWLGRYLRVLQTGRYSSSVCVQLGVQCRVMHRAVCIRSPTLYC